MKKKVTITFTIEEEDIESFQGGILNEISCMYPDYECTVK